MDIVEVLVSFGIVLFFFMIVYTFRKGYEKDKDDDMFER